MATPTRGALASAVKATLPTLRTSRRVAVVGGGSAGVTAARHLRRAGHRPWVFESGPSFGGVWADNPTNDVVYRNLRTNLPTCVMQSPDLDFHTGTSYVSKPQLGAYIESYAREFGVGQTVTFGATVTSVAPASKTPDEERWTVEWTGRGGAHADTFDAVVVANGHFDKPYQPTLPGEEQWLAGGAGRAIMHSREYDDPEDFRGQCVLVVGAGSSGTDISRELLGVAKWLYVLEKRCTTPRVYEAEAAAHVPLGTRLCADGLLRLPVEDGGGVVAGPPVDRVLLATGYVYSFPFLDAAALGMSVRGRCVTPLYRDVLHARRPTLGFVGMNFAVPCPIPFFECQATLLAEQWARPSSGEGALTTAEEREAWVRQRVAAVGDRPQDLHSTRGAKSSPWENMRELVRMAHAGRPPAPDADCWLERADWERRLATVEEIYGEGIRRKPKLAWHDDAYRRCDYTVDWATGSWGVDDSRARSP